MWMVISSSFLDVDAMELYLYEALDFRNEHKIIQIKKKCRNALWNYFMVRFGLRGQWSVVVQIVFDFADFLFASEMPF